MGVLDVIELYLFSPEQEAENIVSKIKQQQYQDLLMNDQLTQERQEEKVFIDYGILIHLLQRPEQCRNFIAVLLSLNCEFNADNVNSMHTLYYKVI